MGRETKQKKTHPNLHSRRRVSSASSSLSEKSEGFKISTISYLSDVGENERCGRGKCFPNKFNLVAIFVRDSTHLKNVTRLKADETSDLKLGEKDLE